MKLREIEPGLYRVRDGKKAEVVYRIDNDARMGTRYRDFGQPGGYSVIAGTAKLHVEATKIDVDTQQPDPWTTFIRLRDIVAPFTFPKVTKAS